MIPVRGPTLFEKQLTEFVNGPASKSGMAKGGVLNKMQTAMKKKVNEMVEKEKEEKVSSMNTPIRRKQSMKAGVPKVKSI